MTVDLAGLFTFLNSLPIVRNLPGGVKRFLGSVLTVLVGLAAVLAVVSATGPALHIPTTDLTYISTATAVSSAVINELRVVLGQTAAKQAAAKEAAAKAKYAPPAAVPSA